MKKLCVAFIMIISFTSLQSCTPELLDDQTEISANGDQKKHVDNDD